jgi:hypothetical protein
MRTADRILGRGADTPSAFGTRPFGTSAAEAAAIAATAGRVPVASAPRNADGSGTAAPGLGGSGSVTGTTSGAAPNMTTSSYGSPPSSTAPGARQ